MPDVTRVHRRLTLRMRAKRFASFDLRPQVAGKDEYSLVSVTSSHRGTGIVAAMSLQGRTGEVFQLLEVEQLPEEWVGRCWDENFCESTPLPPQVLLLASVASIHFYRLPQTLSYVIAAFTSDTCMLVHSRCILTHS